MAKKTKDSNLSIEERLEQALIPNWDEPYKLPNNWCWVRVDAIASIYTGNSINERVKEEKYTGRTDGLVYLATKDIDFDSTIDYDTNVCIPQSDGFKVAPKYSTLLCIEGGSAGRKIGFITQDVCFVNKLCAFVPHGKINPKYLYYAIQSDAFKKQFDAKKHGLIGGVSVKEVSSIFIPFAPVEIQNKIVELIESVFNKLDEAKEKAQEVVDGFETRKAAILYKAFSGELTAKWREENGVSNNTWVTKSLGDVCKSIYDGDHMPPPKSESGIPFLVISNVNTGYLSFEDTRFVPQEYYDNITDTRKPQNGDLLYTLVGSYGIPVVVDADKAFCFQRHMALLKPLSVDTYFLWYLLQTQEMYQKATAIAKGVAQLTVPIKGLRAMKFSCPSIEEQQEIVRLLDALIKKELRVKEAAEAVIEQIDTIKKAILARAFRGELGTNDPSEESALELLKNVLLGNTNKQAPTKPNKKSTSIPNHIEMVLLTKLEKKIVSLFYTTESKVVSVDEIMSVSPKKIDIIDTLTKLEQRGILIRLNNSCYRIKE